VASAILDQDRVQRKHSFTFSPCADFGYAVGSVAHNGATIVYFPQVNKQRVQIRQDVKAITMLHSPARTKADAEALQPITNSDGSVTYPDFSPTSTLDIRPGASTLDSFADAADTDTYTFGDMASSEQSLWPKSTPSSDSPDHVPVSTTVPACITPEPPRKRPKRHHQPPSQLKDYVLPDAPTPERLELTTMSSSEPTGVASTLPPPLAPFSSGHDPGLLCTDPWDLDDFIDISYVEPPSTYSVNASSSSNSSTHIADPDNPTLAEAQNSPEWETIWAPACVAEMDNLAEHDVGDEVTLDQIPPDATIYPTKMGLKKKRDTSGIFTKAKARLCVIGNLFANLFQSLFAPTVNERSVKLIFFLSIIFGLFVTGIDVKGAS